VHVCIFQLCSSPVCDALSRIIMRLSRVEVVLCEGDAVKGMCERTLGTRAAPPREISHSRATSILQPHFEHVVEARNRVLVAEFGENKRKIVEELVDIQG
jgi:hypothetical protein